MTTNTTKIQHTSKLDNNFPAFYVCTGIGADARFVILATKREGDRLTGTVVANNGYNTIGFTSDWDICYFERLNGSFTVTQGQ